jgi:cytochrome d ubiquinol oxidase subunit II
VLGSDAHPIYRALVHGDGLPALVVSALAGLATLALVWERRYELARYTSAVAVAAVIAGWALAQYPTFLPGLTVQQAAAPRSTLIALVVAVIAGAAILFPSLTLLFGLLLSGRLDHGETAAPLAPTTHSILFASAPGLLARAAGGCLLAGVGLLTVAEAGWAHAAGVVSLLAFVALGFTAAVPSQLAAIRCEEAPPRVPDDPHGSV